MPRGRRPLPRGVWSFEDDDLACPEQTLLDTSFVVEALLASQPLHQACQDYLVRLADENVRIFFSRQLELELQETLFQLALKERHPKDWKRFRHDGRARSRAARLMNEGLVAWRETVAALEATCVDVHTSAHLVPRLMTDYGLASYDAVHAATAIEMRINCIVTTDAGFARAPEALLTIYTDNTRISVCRRMRT